jgi:hypothetical protein
MKVYGRADAQICRCVVNFTVQPLYSPPLPQGKGPTVSIGQKAGWAPEPVWTIKRNFLSLPGLKLQPVSKPSASCYTNCYHNSSEKSTMSWRKISTNVMNQPLSDNLDKHWSFCTMQSADFRIVLTHFVSHV